MTIKTNVIPNASNTCVLMPEGNEVTRLVEVTIIGWELCRQEDDTIVKQIPITLDPIKTEGKIYAVYDKETHTWYNPEQKVSGTGRKDLAEFFAQALYMRDPNRVKFNKKNDISVQGLANLIAEDFLSDHTPTYDEDEDAIPTESEVEHRRSLLRLMLTGAYNDRFSDVAIKEAVNMVIAKFPKIPSSWKQL